LVALFSVTGCGDNSAALKMLVGSYSVTVGRGDLPGKSDNDIMSAAIGHDGVLLFIFEVGITTDPGGPNPNGLIAHVDGMNLKLDRQPAHIDYSTGTLDGTLTGDGTIGPSGTGVTLNLHYVPTNYAIPDGSATLEYTVMGAKM